MIENGVKDKHTYFGTSLLCAIKQDGLHLTLLLLADGGAVVTQTEIEQAARNGNEAILQLLLDPKYKDDVGPLDYLCALRAAAAGGQLDTIDFLIQRAITQNKLDDVKPLTIVVNGWKLTPVYDAVLLEAILYGQQEIVQAALDNGANPHARPRMPRYKWCSALDAAALMGYEGIVRLLLGRGAHKELDALQGAFLLAIQGGWLRIAQLLIDNGAELDSDMFYGKCHLINAVRYGQADMLELLLDTKGAGLNADSDFVKEAYSLAVSHGYTTITSRFVEHGLVSHISAHIIETDRA
jgi:ankyrin repeat protein